MPPKGQDQLSLPEKNDNLEKMLLQIPNVVKARKWLCKNRSLLARYCTCTC